MVDTNIRVSRALVKRFRDAKRKSKGVKIGGVPVNITHEAVYSMGLDALESATKKPDSAATVSGQLSTPPAKKEV